MKLTFGFSSDQLTQLSEQLNVPKQERVRGPEGIVYFYSDEHLLRMALDTQAVRIERDEESGLTKLVGEKATITLSLPYEQVAAFKK